MNLFLVFQSFTKTERALFLGAGAIFVVSSIFWGSQYLYRNSVTIPIQSEEYIEGIIGQPTFINPVIAGANDVDRDLSELLFSDLLDLADHYKASADGKTWNIILKNDIAWSDGKPLTSDDVIFTIETIQNIESRSPLFLTWQGVVVNRVSELEIEFNLRVPYAFFAENLRDLKPIPKHIFGVIPAANIRLSNYNLEPVGSGPYVFVSYDKRKDGFITEYRLTTNKHYPSDKPFLYDFIVRFYPGTAEIIRAFNNRSINGFGDLNPNNLDALKLSHQIVELAIPRYYAVFINQNSHPALKDISVRTALNLSAPTQEIIEKIFNNKALAIHQPILPTMEGYDATAEQPAAFSLEEATALLEQEGWKITGDGVRAKKIGGQTVMLQFDMVIPQIPFLTETAALLQETWKKIGILVNPIILNPTDITNEVIKTRNYQMLLFGNVLKINPDLFSFWHSTERFYPGLNLSLYDNKKADSLLESIRKNLDDQSRLEELSKLQTLISNDQPAVFLFSPAYLYVTSKNFGGLEKNMIATASERFEHVNQWYVDTERVLK